MMLQLLLQLLKIKSLALELCYFPFPADCAGDNRSDYVWEVRESIVLNSWMSLGRDLLHRQDVIVRSFEATAPWSLLVKAASAAIMQ